MTLKTGVRRDANDKNLTFKIKDHGQGDCPEIKKCLYVGNTADMRLRGRRSRIGNPGKIMRMN